jgi:hypothetical protein
MWRLNVHAEQKGEQGRKHQRRDYGEREIVERRHEVWHARQAVPFHKVRNLAAIAGRVGQRIIELERQGDHVGADAEIDGLAEAQDAGEAPDQIDAERKDRITKKLAEQRQHIGIAAVIGIGADQRHHGGAADQGPQRNECRGAISAALCRRRFLLRAQLGHGRDSRA